MSAIQNNLKISEFNIDDIQAGVNLLKEFSEAGNNTYSFVLDPSAGNFSLITSQNVVNTGAYAIGPIRRLGKYTNIHEYVNLLLKDPQLYSENPSIICLQTQDWDIRIHTRKYKELREEFKIFKYKIYKGICIANKEDTYIFSNEQDFEYSIDQISKNIEDIKKEKPSFITNKPKRRGYLHSLGKQILTEPQL